MTCSCIPGKSALPVSVSMKRKNFCIWMSGPEKKGSGKEGNSLDIEYMLKLIANNGFPLVLSVYLVYKLEFFINEIIKNQKEFSRNVTVEIKEIKKTISDLRVDFAKNQWKRWLIWFWCAFQCEPLIWCISALFFWFDKTYQQDKKYYLNSS